MQENKADPNTLENKIHDLTTEMEKTKEALEEDKEYISEIKKYYAIDIIIIVLLTAIVASTFLYIINAEVITDMDLLYYMFSMLICPSAFLLLFLHVWAVYKTITTEKESVPFVLDFMYLIYVPLAFFAMFTLNYFYRGLEIPYNFLTPGWIAAAMLLLVEVVIAFFLSARIVAKKLSEIFPHLVPSEETTKTDEKQVKIKKQKLKKRIKIKKKQDLSIWETQDCFVKYKI